MIYNRLRTVARLNSRVSPITNLVRLKHASTVDVVNTKTNRTPNTNQGNGIDRFDSGNGDYVEAMYKTWQNNPTEVHISWQIYFSNFTNGNLPFYQPPPNLISSRFNNEFGVTPKDDTITGMDKVKAGLTVEKDANSYRKLGHNYAALNPLNNEVKETRDRLDLLNNVEIKDELVELNENILPGYFNQGVQQLSVSEIHKIYQTIYCSSVGYEFEHIDPVEHQFLKTLIEAPVEPLSTSVKLRALAKVLDTHYFESIFALKFKTVKRYGIEGADSMIPALSHLFDCSTDHGIQEIIIGMPHRGRLNLFCNLMNQPVENVYNEFSGLQQPTHPWSNDSSYHLSVTTDHVTDAGKSVHLTLSANPSHLEAVNPVTLGTARYKQESLGINKVLPILLHGDAAIAGQGVVYETQGLQSLNKFSVGGTIHMVVNNQIGFTTNPTSSRSTQYCCDIAKMNKVPVFHVNGDDLDAVLRTMELAIKFRQQFNKDVFIDLITYRRNGHNEVDQPKYTQPKMYSKVDKQIKFADVVKGEFLKEGVLSKDQLAEMDLKAKTKFEKAYELSKTVQVVNPRWNSKRSESLLSHQQLIEVPATFTPTGAQPEHLEKTVKVISSYPDGFNVHTNLIKVLKSRKTMVDEDKIDWPTAELLAFGSLLQEGHPIRISGQDVERGTFSQRHAALIDQKNESQHVPLNFLSEEQAKLEVCNSSLSEFAVLGYELGHSINNLQGLNLWEAQFGDFANVAQPIIDNFIASGELKWLQTSNLIVNLPHGFDGNGPEHSSGRLERFLQLSHEDLDAYETNENFGHQLTNWSIVQPTTPANYFHVLRRQLKRNFRKPLICFNGKSILRSPDARSTWNDLTVEGNVEFEPVYPEAFPEDLVPADQIKKHIWCSGQVYYALIKFRKLHNIKDVAISRIEELTPFPFTKVQELGAKYENAQVTWVQEEPYNMGAYNYILPRFGRLGVHIGYEGRKSNSAVAVGNKKMHLKEQEEIFEKAFKV